MSKVLVTGAGGYIGALLVQELLAAGNDVVAVDRYFFGEGVFDEIGADQKSRLTTVKKDIRDLTPADFHQVDGVCDLAALSNDPSGDLDPELTESINHRGRSHVAICARDAGVRRYILSSSCSVYGTGASDSLTEESPVRPLSVYAKSSYLAEQDTRALADRQFCWTAVRNATVFGLSPRMRFDLVVNLMTLDAVQKGKIFVLGGGQQWRPLVHVRDVARAFMALLAAPTEKVNGQIFNVGYTNAQVLGIAYLVRETLPFRIEIEVAPDDSDKRNYNVSFEKLSREIGYTPGVSIEDGIRQIYDAMKSGRVWARPETSTVGWYKTIIEAERLLNRVKLNGRLI
jgi:nucleoside-diphosphate-sugar epimerase